MTTPPNPTPNNQVPEGIARTLAVADFVARYLADEVISGSTDHQGENPEDLINSLAYVAECYLLEKPRDEYLATQRRALAHFDCELLEEGTPDDN